MRRGLPLLRFSRGWQWARATGAWLETWLDHHVKPTVCKGTYDSYATVVKLDLGPELGRIPLAQLQPEHVRPMLGSLADKGQR